jgi:hypothetical protein
MDTTSQIEGEELFLRNNDGRDQHALLSRDLSRTSRNGAIVLDA